MEPDNDRDFLGRQYSDYDTEPYDSEQAAPAVPPAAAGPRPAFPSGNAHGATAAGHVEVPAETVRTARVGTVVWGLVLVALAVLLLLVDTVGLRMDPTLVALGVTLGAGVALLAGGFLSALQRSRRDQ